MSDTNKTNKNIRKVLTDCDRIGQLKDEVARLRMTLNLRDGELSHERHFKERAQDEVERLTKNFSDKDDAWRARMEECIALRAEVERLKTENKTLRNSRGLCERCALEVDSEIETNKMKGVGWDEGLT